MDNRDREAIDALFEKLAEVEARSAPRDGAAEAFINDAIARQPGAPYYMAQTIIVQNQALEAAKQRIATLEGAPNEDGRSSVRGGRSAVPAAGRRLDAGGGSFLGGAAQTAVGVAGGLMLGNLIGGALFGSPANAAEAAPPEAAPADQGMDQPEMDGGGDFGDFDLGF
jgi:hypothetical protein